MTKQEYTLKRIAYWEEKRPTWKTTPPGIIQKPLKYIMDKTMVEGKDADGKGTLVVSDAFRFARSAAKHGFGDMVKRMAQEAYRISAAK